MNAGPSEISVRKSTRKNKKYVAEVNGKQVHFGDSRYEDYTKHHDKDRQQQYLARHKKDPNGIQTAGFWARELLWSKPSMSEAIRHVEQKTGRKIRFTG